MLSVDLDGAGVGAVALVVVVVVVVVAVVVGMVGDGRAFVVGSEFFAVAWDFCFNLFAFHFGSVTPVCGGKEVMSKTIVTGGSVGG